MTGEKTFLERLDDLWVESTSTEEGLRVRIDLSPLGFAGDTPPEERQIVFTLKADFQLAVERPSGLSIHSHHIRHQGPTKYPWRGGVPSPKSFRPPSAGNARGRQVLARLQEEPVLSTLRYRAYAEATLAPSREAVNAASRRLWAAVWTEIGPHLDEALLSTCRRFGYRWDTYRKLLHDPRTRRFVEEAPGLAFRVDNGGHLTRGGLHSQIVSMLGFTRVTGRPFGHEAAFQEWARRVPWSTDLVPKILSRGRWLGGPAWTLAQEIARLSSEGVIDVNGVRRLEQRSDWVLMHELTARATGSALLRMQLRDPAAARRALARVLNTRPGSMSPEDVRTALEHLEDWRHRGREIQRISTEWAQKLGDPGVSLPDPAARAQGFGRLSRDCLRNLRHERYARNQCELRDWTLPAMLIRQPQATQLRIVLHPDFVWGARAAEMIALSTGLRRHPEVRMRLREHLPPARLHLLIPDSEPEEAVQIWKQLAAADAEEALRVLLEGKLPAGARPGLHDLAPLLAAGGAIAQQAFAHLHVMGAAPDLGPAAETPAPGDTAPQTEPLETPAPATRRRRQA
jgi:hypothetical protein